ncbi:WXG100 family type VII secretion target [Planosporangium thailandense]|uniref:ESAT-6-like protein n=1 Tax=Planosporangium thailandense TaxID=765197 RepID=A0ABX0Y374_9ACTN|nr:WXG100 family type VII secretion target [Planosporangium thailandense]NJC72025.1 WXG100 family type VII secretion target [Planosporangium thailandense]
MSDDSYMANIDGMVTAADDLKATAAQIQQDLQHLEQRIRDLRGTWDGGAAESYAACQAKWDAAAAEMKSFLDAASNSLHEAANIYHATDASVSAGWGG